VRQGHSLCVQSPSYVRVCLALAALLGLHFTACWCVVSDSSFCCDVFLGRCPCACVCLWEEGLAWFCLKAAIRAYAPSIRVCVWAALDLVCDESERGLVVCAGLCRSCASAPAQAQWQADVDCAPAFWCFVVGLDPGLLWSGHGPAPACGLCIPHPSPVNFACRPCPGAVSQEASTHCSHQTGTLCCCLRCVCVASLLHSFLCRPTPESVFSMMCAALREAWCVLLFPGRLAYTSFVETDGLHATIV
jgi:hypothetical protein